ncbi:hypothetical protein EWM64_g10961 [Hericium alpestre]|uniref:Uncharacterized protein n=1 Tax=Hericium alpestre TaxID=135208 RepID=A0A4Y9ZGU6_9AGAM|nr:hypothetical protein EWM64_g10961 [Hericium alpestre]
MSDTKWLQGYMINKDKIRSELTYPDNEAVLVSNWMEIVSEVKLDYLVLTAFPPDKREAVTVIVLVEDYDREQLESTLPTEIPKNLYRFREYLIPGVFERVF